MAAPFGNQFWKMAGDSIGRERAFANPDELWGRCLQYFQWVDDNPYKQKDWVGKDGEEVEREKPLPYTIDDLCFFLGISDETFRNYGTKEGYEDFFGVYTRAVRIIKSQKFRGASIGLFNASIIARDLGLVDKVEQRNEQIITGKLGVTVVSSGIPIATSESDVDQSR